MEVFITAAKRTAIGSFQGSLANTSAVQLAATAMKNVVADIQHDDIGSVLVGNVLQAGQGMGVARQSAIAAGLGEAIPATTINMICGSGMKTVLLAESEIRAGRYHAVLTAGTENMSQTPFVLQGNLRKGNKLGNFQAEDLILKDGLTDAFGNYHMGVTAEIIAKKYNISRMQQDVFAFDSIQKSIAAVDSERFNQEIVPVEVQERLESRQFAADEYPNRNSSPDKLANLKPAFSKDGTVTAGNASGINDGASAILLTSGDYAIKHNLKPLARILASVEAGITPELMGLAPAPAIEKVLQLCGFKAEDIGLWEINEAFAAQSLGVLYELNQSLGIDIEQFQNRLNVNGGAIGLGHPIGCSGNRIIVTLVHEMQRQKIQYGLASLCIGGGMACAVVLERL